MTFPASEATAEPARTLPVTDAPRTRGSLMTSTVSSLLRIKFWNTPSGKPASRTTRSNSSELLCVFGECFTSTTLPASMVGSAMRVSCQIGKFHGMIARIGPSGRYDTYASTPPVGAGASASICAPFSAYQSASRALFSTSASASEMIFPISVVITFASWALFFLNVSASCKRSCARRYSDNFRNDWKLLSARASTASVSVELKNENVSICSPVDGFTVEKPDEFILAPFNQSNFKRFQRNHKVSNNFTTLSPALRALWGFVPVTTRPEVME